ncbi:MAG TPA: (2Fe-2S)-binding protein [Flavobacteriia bacterium]|nr:(2Fe-2S)-binding protein [Flavobacteriia bacterium]
MITLTINAKEYQIDTEPDMPLLWVIRDVVGLTGTKYGCGKGLCGACTVLVDGNPVRSCLTPVSSANGKNILTIEGVENENKVLQEVWEDLNVPQCGYCQSGQIISAVALLDKNENPTDADIDEAMSGNICRCGTYQRIRTAIHKTATLTKTE